MIRCGWQPVTAEHRQKFPDEAAFHTAHGPNLKLCDSWVCECGNDPNKEGFHPDDETGDYRCDRCGRVYDASGRELRRRVLITVEHLQGFLVGMLFTPIVVWLLRLLIRLVRP